MKLVVPWSVWRLASRYWESELTVLVVEAVVAWLVMAWASVPAL